LQFCYKKKLPETISSDYSRPHEAERLSEVDKNRQVNFSVYPSPSVNRASNNLGWTQSPLVSILLYCLTFWYWISLICIEQN